MADLRSNSPSFFFLGSQLIQPLEGSITRTICSKRRVGLVQLRAGVCLPLQCPLRILRAGTEPAAETSRVRKTLQRSHYALDDAFIDSGFAPPQNPPPQPPAPSVAPGLGYPPSTNPYGTLPPSTASPYGTLPYSQPPPSQPIVNVVVEHKHAPPPVAVLAPQLLVVTTGSRRGGFAEEFYAIFFLTQDLSPFEMLQWNVRFR